MAGISAKVDLGWEFSTMHIVQYVHTRPVQWEAKGTRIEVDGPVAGATVPANLGSATLREDVQELKVDVVRELPFSLPPHSIGWNQQLILATTPAHVAGFSKFDLRSRNAMAKGG